MADSREPAEGSILRDDQGSAWLRDGDRWYASGSRDVYTWEQVLQYRPLTLLIEGPTAMTDTPLDRLTGFMQAWDQGEVIAVAASHGQGRQELHWGDLAEARAALLTAGHSHGPWQCHDCWGVPEVPEPSHD